MIELLYIEDNNEIVIKFNYNLPLIEEIKISLEKRRWDALNKVWICKNTPRNRFVLDFLMGKDNYKFFKRELVLETEEGLWRHQNEMYTKIKNLHTHIIAGEMRTGKTKPVLLLISKLIHQGESIGTPWFLSTKSALVGIKRELAKWNFNYNINLITHHKLRSIFGGTKIDMKLKEMIPNIIVWDESHKLKNPNSEIGTLSRQLARLHEDIYKDKGYRILLSGTPSPQVVSDWWNQCEICKPGFVRESNLYHFERRYGEWEKLEGEYGEYPHLIRWKEDEIKKLYTRLKGLVSVYLKKNCLDLPEILYTQINIPINEEYKKYMSLINTTYIKVISKIIALRALSDGFMYNHEYEEETCIDKVTPVYLENNPKINQLKEDLEEYSDVGRMVIYCGFTASVDLVTITCLKANWNVLRIDGRGFKVYTISKDISFSVEHCLDEMDRSLNKKDIEKLVVVGQADAASTGLEFSASPVTIYFSNSFNGANRLQSEARAHSNNMDKERGLEIIDYIHLPTDQLILKNLRAKKAMQSVTLGEIDEWLKTKE